MAKVPAKAPAETGAAQGGRVTSGTREAQQPQKPTNLRQMKLQTLFACALLALASAAPTLQDKHQTTLEVLNNGHVSQDGKFAIVLQRVVSPLYMLLTAFFFYALSMYFCSCFFLLLH